MFLFMLRIMPGNNIGIFFYNSFVSMDVSTVVLSIQSFWPYFNDFKPQNWRNQSHWAGCSPHGCRSQIVLCCIPRHVDSDWAIDERTLKHQIWQKLLHNAEKSIKKSDSISCLFNENIGIDCLPVLEDVICDDELYGMRQKAAKNGSLLLWR